VGSLVGTIVPGVAPVAFAVVYVAQGHASNISFEAGEFVPDLTDSGNLAFAISTIMIFAGIELMGTRVEEIRDPARTYPRATFISIALATLLLVPTVLAIAVLVPATELNITAGIVQAMQTVFDSVWKLSWVPQLVVQLYLLMYMLLFAAVWWLRRSRPDQPRPWRIPGGRAGITLVCGVGLVFSVAAFLVGFLPPSSLDVGSANYLAVLCSALGMSLFIPVALILLRAHRVAAGKRAR